MKSETPRTDEAQELFQDEYGSGHYVVESNFARTLERELIEMRKALDELHIVIECAQGDVIHDWYCNDPIASQAREKALQILNRRGDA